ATRLLKGWARLQQAHDETFAVSTFHQNALDLAMFFFSQARRGEVSSRGRIDGEPQPEVLRLSEAEGDTASNRNAYIMLEEIYRLHRRYGPRGENRPEECPIYVLAPRGGQMLPPIRTLVIDTYSLKFSVDDRIYELPSSSGALAKGK